MRLRRPTLEDGATLWHLAAETRVLDENSPYAYLMWCEHFAATSVVAEVDGEPAGFVLGFRPPERPSVLFVWQVGVSDRCRGLGIASRMLDELAARDPGVTALEATVTPSNAPSQGLFRAFARRRACACREAPHLEARHFPGGEHEPETLFHIGPFPTN